MSKQHPLIKLLLDGHSQVACRPNPSWEAYRNAMVANKYDVPKSVAAGLCSTGGKHAPIDRTVEWLTGEDPILFAKQTLGAGDLLDGFGSSYHKGEIDPAFIPWWNHFISMKEHRFVGGMVALVDYVGAWFLNHKGKAVAPNPSFFTACTAIYLLQSKGGHEWAEASILAQQLFITGRLHGWFRAEI